MKTIRKISSLSRHTMIIVALLTASSASLAADSEVETMLKCKSMQDDAERLACYDSLNSPSSTEPPAPVEQAAPVAPPAPVEQAAPVVPPAPVDAEPAAASVTATPKPAAAAVPAAAEQSSERTPETLSDKVGRETLGPKKGEEVLVRGQIVRCREDLSGKYVFYFANGQVWRQRDNSRIRWDECNFEVTISKDFFGYKMIRDGEKKKVRIAREK